MRFGSRGSVAIVASAVGFGGAGLALGAAGDDEITACVNQGSGLVRIVDSSDDCRAAETPQVWNRQGPQGEQGPPGPPGPGILNSGMKTLTGSGTVDLLTVDGKRIRFFCDATRLRLDDVTLAYRSAEDGQHVRVQRPSGDWDPTFGIIARITGESGTVFAPFVDADPEGIHQGIAFLSLDTEANTCSGQVIVFG